MSKSPCKEHPLIVFQRSKTWKGLLLGYWIFIVIAALFFYYIIISTLF